MYRIAHLVVLQVRPAKQSLACIAHTHTHIVVTYVCIPDMQMIKN